MMTEKQKRKWNRLYNCANEIGSYQPWAMFDEEDIFSYIWHDRSKVILFTFLGDSIQRCGIACYIGEPDFMQARHRRLSKNEKKEPVFVLQNSFVAIWGNREDVDKESYNLIKELGYKFRGKGAWLHFERYRIGYAPVPLDESEVDFLTEAFGNLLMMVRAVCEDRLDPCFDENKVLLRWYEPEDDLYYTHPFEIPKLKAKPDYAVVTMQNRKQILETIYRI